MQKVKICPKCKGEMNAGTFTGNQIDWETESKQNFLQHSGKKIITYACENCGYIESYVQK